MRLGCVPATSVRRSELRLGPAVPNRTSLTHPGVLGACSAASWSHAPKKRGGCDCTPAAAAA
eukprot:330771-Alexandrium_andersonii.AAC.1